MKDLLTRQWAWAAVSGTTGLLLGGTGAMYAPNVIDLFTKKNGDGNMQNGPEAKGAEGGGDEQATSDKPGEDMDDMPHDEELLVGETSDNMSFGDAFAAAREDVGPGGIFFWHGGVYSTYYKEEWESMTDEEKAEYGDRANAVIPEPDDPGDAVQPMDVEEMTGETLTRETAVKEMAGEDTLPTDDTRQTAQQSEEPASDDSDKNSLADGGGEANMNIVGHTTVNGHAAMEVDVDNDGQADALIVDIDDTLDVTAEDMVIEKNGDMTSVGGEYVGNIFNEDINDDLPDDSDKVDVVAYGEYDGHLNPTLTL